MSEIKHTPGPWRVGYWGGQCLKPTHQGINHPGPRGDDPCIYTPHFVEGLYGIASENGEMVVTTVFDELVMNEADARLIAAAPELLEALSVLVENIAHAMPSSAQLGPVIKARAAIAKAIEV